MTFKIAIKCVKNNLITLKNKKIRKIVWKDLKPFQFSAIIYILLTLSKLFMFS